MGNIRTIADLIGLIRRRFWLISSVFIIGIVVTLIVSGNKPRAWESVAVLQMELPRVAANAAPGESLSHSSQRMQLLEQQLGSRDSLFGLAERHHILVGMPPLPPAQLLGLLREAVRVEIVRSPQQNFGAESAISAMRIRVTLQDPQMAANVANDVAQQILSGTANRQSAEVRDTLEFYASEEARLSTEITAVEAEITTFQNNNIDALPESLTSRREQMSALLEQNRDYDRQLMEVMQELAPLQARENATRAVEQRRIANLTARRDALQVRQDMVQTHMRALQNSLDRTPMIETQLGTLTRRQAQLQEQYAVVNRRRAEAETTQRLESEQQTERFTLLETALPADYPMSSGRRKMMAMGGMASALLALGLAFLLELRHPSIRSARQMEAILGLRPVIALPDMSRKRRRGWGRAQP